MDSNKTYIQPDKLPKGFESATYFQDGLAVVVKNGRTYYINKNGEEVFPSISFEDADLFSDGFARVQVNGKKGYMNKSGEIWSGEKEIEDLLELSEGYAFLKYKDDPQWRCIDKNLKEVFKLGKSEPVEPFSEGFAVVRRHPEGLGRTDWYSETYKFSDDPNENCFWEDADSINYVFEEEPGNDVIENEESSAFEYNFIDKTGRLLLKRWCLSAESFKEGFAVVRFTLYLEGYHIDSNEYNFINKEGKLLRKENFALAESFSEGLGVVFLYRDFEFFSYHNACFINKDGELLLPRKPEDEPRRDDKYYSDIKAFDGGVSCIMWDQRISFDYGYKECEIIDHEGKILQTFTDDEKRLVFGYKEGYAGFVEIEEFGFYQFKVKRYYYLDKNGQEVFNRNYESIDAFHEGLAIVQLAGSLYFMNNEGTILDF